MNNTIKEIYATTIEHITKAKDNWNKEIIEILREYSTMNQIDLSNIQFKMLYQRQLLVEEISNWQLRYSKSKAQIEEVKVQSYAKVMDDISLKKLDLKNASFKDRELFVNANMNTYNLYLSCFEIYIAFLKESISTLDKLGFSLKNNIAIN